MKTLSAVRRPNTTAAWLLIGFACLAVLSCDRGPDGPRNVILVTLDTTRADRLGCYGHERAITPVLDSLAARGVVFEQAFTSVPITLPAHSSILTGLYPTRHGVRDNGVFVLSDDFETVAERLHAHGYQTGAFVSAFVLEKSFGTAQGFTTYDDRFYGERSALLTARRAAHWLDDLDPERPFFLWLHFYDPHVPLDAPEPYRSLPGLDPYDQEVATMDAGLGIFLEALRAHGLDDRTDLLLVGDHGEGLGDHGEYEHGLFLYDATLHVPLILVRADGRSAGRRQTELAHIQDVAPTLLAMAGVDPPAPIDGHDLLARVAAGGTDPERAAYAETYFPEYSFYHSHIFALRTLDWKYVSAPQPELYNLQEDPGELRNRIDEMPQTAEELAERLRRVREETLGKEDRSQTITSEELERLQSLGYLGGGELAMEMESGGEFVLPDPKEMADLNRIYSEGLAALDAGNLTEARALMVQVLERNPENVIMRINLGKLLIQLNEGAAAVEQLEHAVALAPNSASAKKYLGMAQRLAGRYEEALATLRKIEDDPVQYASAAIEIARTQLVMGKAEEAQYTYRVLSDRVGGSPEFSGYAQRIGDYIEAQRRVEDRSDDHEARLELAAAALDLRLLDEAERALRFHAADPHVEARRHLTLGSVAGARGDLDTALREYELARPQLGHTPYLRTQIAALYLEFGRAAEAYDLLDGLIRSGHIDPVIYYNQACALAHLRRPDEALRTLTRAVRAGYNNLQNLYEDPDLDPLREDPRFLDVLDLAASLEDS